MNDHKPLNCLNYFKKIFFPQIISNSSFIFQDTTTMNMAQAPLVSCIFKIYVNSYYSCQCFTQASLHIISFHCGTRFCLASMLEVSTFVFEYDIHKFITKLLNCNQNNTF